MLRPYKTVRILRRRNVPLPPPGCAALIQDHVDGKPMQPGAERALTPERAQLVPEPHEYVLRAFVGIARIAGETEAERIDTTGVLAVQLPKSGLVAGLGTGDEIRRGGRGRHVLKTPAGGERLEHGQSSHAHDSHLRCP